MGWRRLNRHLSGNHKWLGWILIGVGLVHGLLSSQTVLSPNLGTLSWLLSILLGLNWLLRDRLARRPGWLAYHRVLTVIFLVCIVFHVVNVGGIRIHRVILGDETAQLPSGESTGQSGGYTLRDGTYTGTAQGFRPGLTVSVVVKSNRIVSVTVTNHNEENQRIYGRAMQAVPQRIVNQQSLNVDTVAGATRTSNGILAATRNALQKALISGTLPGSTD
jgi:uncharacterized protein with FMN-binding domain